VRDLRVADVIRTDVTIENRTIVELCLGFSFKYESGE